MNSGISGRKVLGWIWTAFAGIGALSILGQGHLVAGMFTLISGICAFPPLWKAIAEKGIAAPTWSRAICGIAAIFTAAAIMPRVEVVPEVVSLASLEEKIADGAVTAMDRSDYSDTYSRLGGDAFQRANELMKWPVVAVAASPRCNVVDDLAVSDRATADELEWLVDCDNREQFRVSEAQAVATRDSFNTDGIAQVELDALEPLSAVFDDLSEGDVVYRCDEAVKSTMKSQSSFDTEWDRQITRDVSSGRIMVAREFEAQNSFGASLSSQYECIVDVETMVIVSLRIREGNGWQTLYSE